jgi:hypothetical protein
MGVVQMIKSAVGVGDSVGDLDSQITVAKAKRAAAQHEIERLEGVRVGAESYEDAQAAETRLGRVRWEVSRIDALLPQLEARLVSARAVKQRDALARHLAAARAMYPKLRQAVEAASATQAEAIKVREAANAELGESLVSVHIPIVAFRGLLLPDLVAMWRNEMDRVFAVPVAQPAPVAVVAPKVQPVAQKQPAAPKPRAVRFVEPASSAPRRPRNPDDMAPLMPGEMRVKVLRPGFTPGDDQPQCDGQQVIRMPVEAAKLALANGAVEIVE